VTKTREMLAAVQVALLRLHAAPALRDLRARLGRAEAYLVRRMTR
jgi:hypothetical protein